MNRGEIKKLIKDDWYVQGFNGVPLYLNPSAYSGIELKNEIGFGYTKYLFFYQKGLGEMWYYSADLKKMWSQIKNEIHNDKNFLKNLKNKYDEIISKNKIENFNELNNIDDEELLTWFKKCLVLQKNAVGLAHICEPIGLEGDREFKILLENYCHDSNKINLYYTSLTKPNKQSFIAEEESELQNISKMPEDEIEKALKDHRDKYCWIENSYRGFKKLPEDVFRKKMVLLKNDPKTSYEAMTKEEILNEENFSSEILDLAETLSFVTVWMDERKANVLKAIEKLGLVTEEITKRLKIQEEEINYLGFQEGLKLEKLEELKKMGKELAQRYFGTFFVMDEAGEKVYCGADFEDLVEYKNGLVDHQQADEIRGSIANGGTVIGKVAVCLNISSLHKVQEGDIIVASMTRPEYLPALKKSGGIVTDEGGITCHAAIISRELGIPAVIGTKIATKNLRDGMIVELKANHGLVKILE